jgi:hypothetical protein
LETGDGREALALVDLKEAFGLHLSEEEIARIDEMTLSEFVDFVLARQSQPPD